MSLRLVNGDGDNSENEIDETEAREALDLFYSQNYGFTMCKHCLIPISNGTGEYCSPICEAADK